MLTNVVVRNTDTDALAVFNGNVAMNGGELSRVRQTAMDIVNGSGLLIGVSILGSNGGFYVQDATFKMRNCVIADNGFGGALGVRAVADLGTVSDPGNNVFTNRGAGLSLENGGPAPTLVDAVGNIWKPAQGADQNGRYPVGTVMSGPFTEQGLNFYTALNNISVRL